MYYGCLSIRQFQIYVHMYAYKNDNNLSMHPSGMLNIEHSQRHSTLNRHFSDKLMFISFKFVKGFLAITFLFIIVSNWNVHDVRQRF